MLVFQSEELIYKNRNITLAISFARMEFVKRSNGGDSCRSAAYFARAQIRNERTGQIFYFEDRDKDLAYHEVLLPEGVDARFKDLHTLWNEIERSERRRDSQVSVQLVLALPDDVLALDIMLDICQLLPVRANVIPGPANKETYDAVFE